MKGISHFITGIALASCFPHVMREAGNGGLLLVLGGIGGLMPDVLDFKFARYFERYDVAIDPGADPDASKIGDAFSQAMETAYRRSQPVNVILHTIRAGLDLWKRYSIYIDPQNERIGAEIGPLVSTSQVPVEGTQPSEGVVWRKIGVPFEHTYQQVYHVDIFTGPSFRLVRSGERLRLHFLDWHHRWSHSLLLSIVWGLLFAAVSVLFGRIETALWAGIVSCLGFAGHALEDQMGFMGCNLFWPLTRKRIRGLGLWHAGDAVPNVLVILSSLVVIFINMDQYGPSLIERPLWFAVITIGLPWCLAAIRSGIRKLRNSPDIDQLTVDNTDTAAEADTQYP